MPFRQSHKHNVVPLNLFKSSGHRAVTGPLHTHGGWHVCSSSGRVAALWSGTTLISGRRRSCHLVALGFVINPDEKDVYSGPLLTRLISF